MLKFYIVKRDEFEGDGYRKIMEFDGLAQFLRFAEYHRNYIAEIKTLDTDSTYSFTNSEGETVSD
jgi:hypothetical protein